MFHPKFTAANHETNHGINIVEDSSEKRKQFKYYWHIPCDCSDEGHTTQTGRNLRWAVEQLKGPSKGIELLFLKQKSDTIEAYLIKEEKFSAPKLIHIYSTPLK